MIIYTTEVSAHGMQDYFGGIVISSPLQYESKSHNFYSGINANIFFFFLNMSLEHSSIINGNDNSLKYSWDWYAILTTISIWF
jgi:hypothetical protein